MQSTRFLRYAAAAAHSTVKKKEGIKLVAKHTRNEVKQPLGKTIYNTLYKGPHVSFLRGAHWMTMGVPLSLASVAFGYEVLYLGNAFVPMTWIGAMGVSALPTALLALYKNAYVTRIDVSMNQQKAEKHGLVPDLELRFAYEPLFGAESYVDSRISEMFFKPRFYTQFVVGQEKKRVYLDAVTLRSDPTFLADVLSQVISQSQGKYSENTLSYILHSRSIGDYGGETVISTREEYEDAHYKAHAFLGGIGVLFVVAAGIQTGKLQLPSFSKRDQ